MKKNTKLQKAVRALPLAGLALAALVTFGFAGVVFSYAVAIAAAWKSAMAALVFFGAAFLAAGLCAITCDAFYRYLTQKYLAEYSPACRAVKEKPTAPVASKVIKQKAFTVQNAGYALMAAAVVAVIASAALGCLKADNWTDARRPYMESVGYYAQSQHRISEYDVTQITTIELNVDSRSVVVKYADVNKISIDAYWLYDNEYSISHSSAQKTLRLTRDDGDCPPLTTALDRMLALMFKPNKIENQVIITVPLAYRDKIEITGSHIIAKE